MAMNLDMRDEDVHSTDYTEMPAPLVFQDSVFQDSSSASSFLSLNLDYSPEEEPFANAPSFAAKNAPANLYAEQECFAANAPAGVVNPYAEPVYMSQSSWANTTPSIDLRRHQQLEAAGSRLRPTDPVSPPSSSSYNHNPNLVVNVKREVRDVRGSAELQRVVAQLEASQVGGGPHHSQLDATSLGLSKPRTQKKRGAGAGHVAKKQKRRAYGSTKKQPSGDVVTPSLASLLQSKVIDPLDTVMKQKQQRKRHRYTDKERRRKIKDNMLALRNIVEESVDVGEEKPDQATLVGHGVALMRKLQNENEQLRQALERMTLASQAAPAAASPIVASVPPPVDIPFGDHMAKPESSLCVPGQNTSPTTSAFNTPSPVHSPDSPGALGMPSLDSFIDCNLNLSLPGNLLGNLSNLTLPIVKPEAGVDGEEEEERCPLLDSEGGVDYGQLLKPLMQGLGSAGVSVLVVGPDCNIREVNSVFLNVTGYEKKDLMGVNAGSYPLNVKLFSKGNSADAPTPSSIKGLASSMSSGFSPADVGREVSLTNFRDEKAWQGEPVLRFVQRVRCVGGAVLEQLVALCPVMNRLTNKLAYVLAVATPNGRRIITPCFDQDPQPGLQRGVPVL